MVQELTIPTNGLLLDEPVSGLDPHSLNAVLVNHQNITRSWDDHPDFLPGYQQFSRVMYFGGNYGIGIF